MQTYRAVHLVARPQQEITADVFTLATANIPEPQEGEFLIKVTHLSLDPAMRGWMSADENSYIPPVKLGDVMRASGVGEVVASRHPDYPEGTRVMGLTGMQEYLISNGAGMNKVPQGLPTEAVLAVISLPGVTAYHGLFEVLHPESGQTLVITAAAGSVGSLVGQMAKNQGVRVVGVVGNEEKARWITEELGFDAALNYREQDFAKQLAIATPDGIDLFFENTGGVAQGPIFARMNAHGRIAVCGLIAEYNKEQPDPGPSWINIIKRRLSIQGFTMPDHFDRFAEYGQALGEMLVKGELKYRTHMISGIENAPDAIKLLFSGDNQGKLIVQL
ncbi:NADP-dependent oxidoreductase [Vibrio mangrovi]|uniref:NADP-dependent oxidoreductase n=1 Tax=Vibrio mangrovi TaxID=474394 RepID=A0A1Y6IU54_9VIBR|nr:NADP-dependent oxidoreductase [Vibrio mangrovi]MDW6001427.1 NADP-dependent oxidoreductase [Vibrio mangrovi]SMS00551.1 NADPH-dependent curcumin reductase [Vibrio mangrovi]